MADDTMISTAVAHETAPPELPKPGPWGFWATLGFGVLAVAGAYAAALVIGLSLMAATWLLLDRPFELDDSSESVWLQLVMIFALAVAGTALLFLFAKLRKGVGVVDYFAFHPVSAEKLAVWSTVSALSAFAYLAVFFIEQTPVNFEVLSSATVATSRPIWLGEVIVVPLFTVLLFQGFLLRGFIASPIGTWGGITATLVLWCALWVIDGVPNAIVMAVFGVLLTWARLQTGSVLTPCLMLVIERFVAISAVLAFKLPVD